MNRRAFLRTLSGSLLAAPLSARAQQVGRVYRIGSINDVLSATPQGQGTFYDRMRELGWIHGQNFVVERRAYGVQPERIPDLAADLMRWGAELFIVGAPSEATRVLEVTRTIPIVVSDAALLVQPGLAASIAKPGGSVTGIQTLGPEVAGKLVELLKEGIPGLSRLGILTAGYDPAVIAVEAVEARAKALGIRVQFASVSRLEDFDSAFSALRGGRAQGLLVVRTPLTSSYRKLLVGLALKHRLPTISDLEFFASDGGLLSYGFDILEALRLVAETINEILRGTHSSEVPIRQVTTFTLTINLKTAKALGLSVPPSLLQRADQVIE